MWILTICTAGWVLCGQHNVYEYKSEEACYRALKKTTETSQKIKYIICSPKPPEDK